MKIEGKIFYHIHRTNWRHSEEWAIGNEIDTEKHERNYYFQGLLDEYHPKSHINNAELHIVDKIVAISNENNDAQVVDFGQMSLAQIKDLQSINLELRETLYQSGELLEQSLKVVREFLFEDVRKRSFSSCPSRLNSIWLCDAVSLEVWWKEFEDKEDKYIFEVEATGMIFQADGGYITHDVARFSEFISLATNYWEGKEFPIIEKRMPEILFKGRIKVLNRFGDSAAIQRAANTGLLQACSH